jgi:2-keto-4-pentenoate hydratase/2-oxohepta-3-ene-1,7-dioic acid hydratase in catechol pathway
MRLITFEVNGATRWGALKKNTAIDLNLAHAMFLASRGREPQYLADSVLELLQRGEEAWRAAQDTLDFLGTREVEGITFPLARVRLLAPIPRPPKIVAIGLNYWDHCREQNREPPTLPILFAKYPSSVIGPFDVIHTHPEETQKVDFEAELGVVIGKTARKVSAADALEYVFGYTVVNDVSARDLQFSPLVSGQWVRGKSLDTFCPMGPSIVSKDEIPNPQDLAIRATLNGQVMQNSNTKEKIFNIGRLIQFISHGITLEPGDVLATGTPDGVGDFRNPPVYMHAGDVIEIEVEGVGKIRNEVQD